MEISLNEPRFCRLCMVKLLPSSLTHIVDRIDRNLMVCLCCPTVYFPKEVPAQNARVHFHPLNVFNARFSAPTVLHTIVQSPSVLACVR